MKHINRHFLKQYLKYVLYIPWQLDCLLSSLQWLWMQKGAALLNLEWPSCQVANPLLSSLNRARCLWRLLSDRGGWRKLQVTQALSFYSCSRVLDHGIKVDIRPSGMFPSIDRREKSAMAVKWHLLHCRVLLAHGIIRDKQSLYIRWHCMSRPSAWSEACNDGKGKRCKVDYLGRPMLV